MYDTLCLLNKSKSKYIILTLDAEYEKILSFFFCSLQNTALGEYKFEINAESFSRVCYW